jgi:hypothetical protein
MSSAESIANVADPDGKWLYRVGGVCALVFGIAYIVIIALYVPVGAPPSGGEARLEYHAGNTAVWWAIVALSVLTDFLLIPVALSLCLALKRVNRDAMLLATAFIGLFVVLDLAVTWPNYASLIALGGDYAAATTDAQREAYIAAANYASAVLGSTLAGVYNIVTLSLGILIAGFVMLRGLFGKGTAYLGLVTGILGIVLVAGPLLVGALGVTIIVASVLTTVWILLVGYRLYRIGRQ